MADFAPNYTSRLKVHYRCGLREHVQTIRFKGTSGADLTAAKTQVSALWTAMAPEMFSDLVIRSAEVAGQNSTVFLPTDSSFISITPSAINATLGDSPQFVTIPGKSAQGNPAILYWFGFTQAGDSAIIAVQDYRTSALQSTAIANVFTVLNNPNSVITAIDRLPVYWQQYANLGYHSHYQRKARQ